MEEEDEWDMSLVHHHRNRRIPKLGYSYPSQQPRNGPAPLASFEDLQTDDQNSPDNPSIPDLDPDSDTIDCALDRDSRNLLCHRSDSTTPVNELPPDDFKASVLTLTETPVVPIKTLNLVTETGLSSYRRKSSPIPSKQCNSSLTEKSDIPEQKRKSSWTDILFRGRSRSRSPIEPMSADPKDVDPANRDEKRKKKGVFSFLKKKKSMSRQSDQTDGSGVVKVTGKICQQLETPSDSASQTAGSPDDRRQAWQILRLPRLSVTEPSSNDCSPAADSLFPQCSSLDRDSIRDQISSPSGTSTATGRSPDDRRLAWEQVYEQSRVSGSGGRSPDDRRLAWELLHQRYRDPGVANTSPEEQCLQSEEREHQVHDPQVSGRSSEDRRAAWEQLYEHSRILLVESQNSDDRRLAWEQLYEHVQSSGLASQNADHRRLAWEQLQEHVKKAVMEGKNPDDRHRAWQLLQEQMRTRKSSDEINPSSPHTPVATQPAFPSQTVIPKRRLSRRTETFDSEISECQSLPEILPSARKQKSVSRLNNNNDEKESIVNGSDDADQNSDAGDEDENSSANSSRLLSAPGKAIAGRIVTIADEHEVAYLLSHTDLNDADENSFCDTLSSHSSAGMRGTDGEPLDTKQSVLQTLSKKERQDVALIPIGRPRSVTPVTVAPLEEYLRRASLSPERVAAERIKLTLPGDQFVACVRSKDPRKSNPQIWLNFCEKAVSSPKVKKMYDWSDSNAVVSSGPMQYEQSLNSSNALNVVSPVSPNDAFTPVDTPLTPITPLEEEKCNAFHDSFDPSNYLITQRLVIPSECNECMCRLKRKAEFATVSPGSSNDESPLMENMADPSLLETQVLLPPKSLPTPIDSLPTVSRTLRAEEEFEAEKEPLMSPNGCECYCHTGRIVSENRVEHESSAIQCAGLSPDPECILSASSDISSESSRLVNSGSSGGSSSDGHVSV